jgi:hypothetical protein
MGIMIPINPILPRNPNASSARAAITGRSTPSRRPKLSSTSRFGSPTSTSPRATAPSTRYPIGSFWQEEHSRGEQSGAQSKETEIKLTNVARASLQELLDDYQDYMRVREYPQWDKDSKEALHVRNLGRKTPQTYELYREFVDTRPPDVVANIAICLIHQGELLDRPTTPPP